MTKPIPKILNTQKFSSKSASNRRDFIKRYGKYAAATPIAMTTLMMPGLSSAACSDGRTAGQCRQDCRQDGFEANNCPQGRGGQACRQESNNSQEVQNCITSCDNNC